MSNTDQPAAAPSGIDGSADGFINNEIESIASKIPGGDGFAKNIEGSVDGGVNSFIESEEKNLPGGLGGMFGQK